MKAFVVMWRTLKALYSDLFLFVWLSFLWWVGTVLILPAAPVTVGLNRVANRVANYKRVDTHFFYQSVRQRIGAGWLLYGGTFLALGLLAFNVLFYLPQDRQLFQILGFAWIWILVIFLLMSQYFFPLFWQQDEPDLKMVVRNSVVLALRHPLYTLLLFLFQVLLVVISVVTVLPILLLTPAALALTANFGLVGLLQEMDMAPPPPTNYS